MHEKQRNKQKGGGGKEEFSDIHNRSSNCVRKVFLGKLCCSV